MLNMNQACNSHAVQNFTSYTKVRAGGRACVGSMIDFIFWHLIQKLRAEGFDRGEVQVESRNTSCLHGDIANQSYAWTLETRTFVYSNRMCELIPGPFYIQTESVHILESVQKRSSLFISLFLGRAKSGQGYFLRINWKKR